MEKGTHDQLAVGTSAGKVTRYEYATPGHRSERNVHVISDGEIVYLCSWPICCQNTARAIILGVSVGVLVMASLALTFASLDENEYAGLSTGGASTELREAYSETSAVLRYLIVCACIALVVEGLAIAGQIVIRCLQMQESEPRSLLFHIPDMIAGVILVLMYVAGGISIAYYASIWNNPPDGCEEIRDLEIQDPCSASTLTSNCILLAVLSIVCGIILLYQAIWSLLIIVKKLNNY